MRVNRKFGSKLSPLLKRKAEFIEPMDCAPVSKLPDGLDWAFEIKLDGYRAIAVKADGRVNLFSGRRKSFHHYPLIVEALGELPEGTVVDGEVVALDVSGRPNFNLLQNFRSEASRIHYFIFDLLVCQDRDLTRLPLSEPRGGTEILPEIALGSQTPAAVSTASVTQPALVIERKKFFLRLNTRRPSARFLVASVWAIGHAIVRVSSCFPVWRATGVTSVILLQQNRLHKIEGFHNEQTNQ